MTTRPVYSDGDKIKISTKVSSEPIKYDTSQRLILVGLKIYLPNYPEIGYGDKVVVEGIVRDGKLNDPKLISLEPVTGILYKTRNNIIRVYQKSLPEPHASLLAGLTLGSKAGLLAGFWEALKKTGTAHVVVASGMNVTLVASFLIGILIILLPRRKAIPLALVGVWIYSLLSGFDAPIVRAAIMGSVAFTAQAFGRLQAASRALFLSAGLMIIVKPDWITDLGFILSFVATASLMLFERKISSLIRFVPGIFREGLSTSLAAQIGVAPILFATFGQLSLLSPLVNALVLWTIAPITIIGGIGGIIGLASVIVGKAIIFLSYPLTTWFVWIVGVFG
ncbi:ComEC/Rec2 family competence protein [Patescibacteria group bacterium]|nr:ComEC/Rec2 family competence protein [Patescibacteria group bacterium]MBU0777248.1 ComEC/Rec2 family competence protein [Patescibacteria group bacterium]MBU0846199.1 ComEC/Rec2 family competence protein [Patescibacteria group bacterium]MBU0922971.1 ComEC/Rec2 family competence protein [Patescibacteria group bacterium]MBU1066179.1 ComEC/Rec2 family competence protein [Patescibacteria group bacterium]